MSKTAQHGAPSSSGLCFKRFCKCEKTEHPEVFMSGGIDVSLADSRTLHTSRHTCGPQTVTSSELEVYADPVRIFWRYHDAPTKLLSAKTLC